METAFLAVARAVHIGACMLLLAGFAFNLLIEGPALRHAGSKRPPQMDALNARRHRLAIWTAVAVLISMLVWLWLVTTQMIGVPAIEALSLPALSEVLTKTHFGRLWIMRFGLLCALGILPGLNHSWLRRSGRTLFDFFCAIIAAALLASLAWSGHADARTGPGAGWALTADAIHLLAAGLWPGGLVPLLLLLAPVRKSGDAVLVRVAAESTRRFSSLAAAMIGTMAVTGIVNAWFLLGDPTDFLSTSYGRVLLSKIAVFIAVAAIAARTRFRLKPALLAAARTPADAASPARELNALTVNLLLEIALATAIIVLVGWLGIEPPPRT